MSEVFGVVHIPWIFPVSFLFFGKTTKLGNIDAHLFIIEKNLTTRKSL